VLYVCRPLSGKYKNIDTLRFLRLCGGNEFSITIRDIIKSNKQSIFDLLKQLADAVVTTFGSNCEVAIHDLSTLKHSLIYLAGNVTKRKLGAPITDMVVSALIKEGRQVKDRYGYETIMDDGRELLERWHGFVLDMSKRFGAADPQARVKWAGPEMSVRSSITARLMETWAHGQAIYDVLGVERVDADRIRNIAVLGVNTFGWTFRNRRLQVPHQMPYVRLTAPSGALWEWGEPSETECVEGSATEFCQVVTQTRNVQDTALCVNGDTATEWMSIAQCFAGPPEQPPAPGTRFLQRPR